MIVMRESGDRPIVIRVLHLKLVIATWFFGKTLLAKFANMAVDQPPSRYSASSKSRTSILTSTRTGPAFREVIPRSALNTLIAGIDLTTSEEAPMLIAAMSAFRGCSSQAHPVVRIFFNERHRSRFHFTPIFGALAYPFAAGTETAYFFRRRSRRWRG
jgi:hypothetical protein